MLAIIPAHLQCLTIVWLEVQEKIFSFSILFLVVMMHQPKCNHDVLFALFENSLNFNLHKQIPEIRINTDFPVNFLGDN
jgi:hypothetical protein